VRLIPSYTASRLAAVVVEDSALDSAVNRTLSKDQGRDREWTK
jgi:hypothetical protein